MKRWFVISLFFLSTGCGGAEGPAGHIVLRNDIQDKKFNTFIVDRVIAKGGLTGFRKKLKPGDKFTVPMKGVRSLRFTRKYEDHSRVYVVKCPDFSKESITMKLIDVHTNRLRGGCKLVKKGKKMKSGVIKWSKS